MPIVLRPGPLERHLFAGDSSAARKANDGRLQPRRPASRSPRVLSVAPRSFCVRAQSSGSRSRVRSSMRRDSDDGYQPRRRSRALADLERGQPTASRPTRAARAAVFSSSAVTRRQPPPAAVLSCSGVHRGLSTALDCSASWPSRRTRSRVRLPMRRDRQTASSSRAVPLSRSPGPGAHSRLFCARPVERHALAVYSSNVAR